MLLSQVNECVAAEKLKSFQVLGHLYISIPSAACKRNNCDKAFLSIGEKAVEQFYLNSRSKLLKLSH